MPRDRGFRDPNLVRTYKEYSLLWQRIFYHKSRNALITHLSRKNYERLEVLALNAQTRLRGFPSTRARPLLKSRPIDGAVFAIKDNIATSHFPTTCASKILKGYRSPYEATVIMKLREEGAIIASKTNMDEFGMGSHSTHSAYGPVTNGTGPHALSVGGSSGGSAYAVASGQCQVALGTDTGGSVRLPAAYLGLVGFKPSYGLLSRHGVLPYANSLDTVGIIARTCLDVFLTFQLLNSPDKQDPTSLSGRSRSRIQEAKLKRQRQVASRNDSLFRVVPLTGHRHYRPNHHDFPSTRRQVYPTALTSDQRYRIGIPQEYNIAELHPLVRESWIMTIGMLEAAGHEIVPISLPSTKAALSAYYVIAPAEAASNLAKYDGVRYGAMAQDTMDDEGKLYAAYRGSHFGDEVKRRILLGSYSLSAGAIDNYFIQAQKVRRLVQRDFDMVFRMKNPLHDDIAPPGKGVDLIVCPTAPTPPPRLAKVEQQSSLDAYVHDVFTVPASLAGLPAISVPAPRKARTDNEAARLVGIQIIGQYGDDFNVLRFARDQFEASGWDELRRLSQPPRFR